MELSPGPHELGSQRAPSGRPRYSRAAAAAVALALNPSALVGKVRFK